VRRKSPAALFIVLFFFDSLFSVSASLITQWATTGLDPIFFNPGLIAVAVFIFTMIESYLPFLILYGLVYEVAKRLFPMIRPSTLCWILLALLLSVSLVVNLLSFGRIDVFAALVEVGLGLINVGVFFVQRVRKLEPPAAPD